MSLTTIELLAMGPEVRAAEPPPAVSLTLTFTAVVMLPPESTISSGDGPERIITLELKLMPGVTIGLLVSPLDPSIASERRLVLLGFVTLIAPFVVLTSKAS